MQSRSFSFKTSLKIVLLNSLLFLAACASDIKLPPPDHARAVTASVESEPVRSVEDAADDPAIWVNSADSDLSRVIGTDKNHGIEVYSLDGKTLQSIPAGQTNNIDLRDLRGTGRWSAIAVASNRTHNSISLFLIDHSGQLLWLEDSEIATGLAEPYGLCMFENATGLQVFVNDKDGRYQQWLLDVSGVEAGSPRVSGQLLREFSVPSQPEGCVADDEHQRLFVGVENEGLRWVSAHHSAPATLWNIEDVGGDNLAADVEGMSIYLEGSKGFLVVSSQGSNSYAIYNRLPPFNYRGSVFVADDAQNNIDGTSDTDGLDVSSLLRTVEFPEGLMVVQDGTNSNPDEAQNFKFISWEEVVDALAL